MNLRRFVRDLAHVAGINLYQLASLRRLPRYIGDWRRYERLRSNGAFPAKTRYAMPILVDYATQAGVVTGHYFHQDLWAARKIFLARPERHVDVGSRLDGFVAHLLTFMPVTVVDFCPLDHRVHGLTFVQGDMTRLNFPDGSIESLSCLHALEHVGLGRYGDPIDPDGWRRALAELARVVKPGGHLYFSVPVGGPERVRFNADRVFAARTIPAALPGLRLLEFSLVGDDERLYEQVDVTLADRQSLGCGLYVFRKE